jgi:hypothetical protein
MVDHRPRRQEMNGYRKLQSEDATVYMIGSQKFVTFAHPRNPFNRGVKVVSRSVVASALRALRGGK